MGPALDQNHSSSTVGMAFLLSKLTSLKASQSCYSPNSLQLLKNKNRTETSHLELTFINWVRTHACVGVLRGNGRSQTDSLGCCVQIPPTGWVPDPAAPPQWWPTSPPCLHPSPSPSPEHAWAAPVQPVMAPALPHHLSRVRPVRSHLHTGVWAGGFSVDSRRPVYLADSRCCAWTGLWHMCSVLLHITKPLLGWKGLQFNR